MEDSTLNRYTTGIKPLAVLSALLVASLFMMNAATQNSTLFGDIYSMLLVINLVGMVLLLSLILINLYRLVVQYRAKVMGTRLTLRLFLMFVLLSVIPVTIVFIFSVQSLNKGIDSWFDVKIKRALDDALLLGRTALDARKQDMVKKGKDIATELEGMPDKAALTSLNQLREQYNITELTLFAHDGKVIASSSQKGLDISSLVPERPSEEIMSQIRKGLPFSSIDPVGNGGLQLRIVVPVYAENVAGPLRTLQLNQQMPIRYTKLGESVQNAFAEYEKLVYLRGPLKFGFTLTLSLVSLLTVLIALWAAFFSSQRIVAPLKDLAEGTHAVAQGDYSKKLPVPGNDELGVLVKSFNEMTQQIHQAQKQSRRSQREAELQRAYLETVLTHLSTGVMSFDRGQHLRTSNAAAVNILEAGLIDEEGQSIDQLLDSHPHLSPFITAIKEGVSSNESEWKTEITLESRAGSRTIMLHGTQLPIFRSRRGGYVVVFDDVTELIRAQRDAAWGEVARRMAHEIKNPLTPIQLSAERIRHKCMTSLSDKERETLDRSTRTIIDQVDSLKSMVNAFSDYARQVQTVPKEIDVNGLVRDVVELYHTDAVIITEENHGKKEVQDQDMVIILTFDPRLAHITADPGRMRQVLHNLILNALDALKQSSTPSLRITTQNLEKNNQTFVQIRIEDNGPGIPAELLDHVFEPYITDKEKGTGLGLAIVKKIIEEHHGFIYAENLEQSGAAITMQLPASQNTTMENHNDTNDSPIQYREHKA
ncbi:MAG TPA: HAMP domain-containing protein [Acidiferrobacteraceae bacterium]|nr:HAMP domain-containing protein [Acidiferrobacteraceae bacterium]HEX20331.1 HAMP domain-containing protein [Acidiferrobacteraceae bacterium]